MDRVERDAISQPSVEEYERIRTIASKVDLMAAMIADMNHRPVADLSDDSLDLLEERIAERLALLGMLQPVSIGEHDSVPLAHTPVGGSCGRAPHRTPAPERSEFPEAVRAPAGAGWPDDGLDGGQWRGGGWAMAFYLVESYDHSIFHDGGYHDGVVGDGPGREKLYLHVLEISDADIRRLKAREDEHGNKQSDRLAPPMNDEWWIAVKGTKAWPKLPLPRLTSHCKEDQHGVPRPQPLDDHALAKLREIGALPA